MFSINLKNRQIKKKKSELLETLKKIGISTDGVEGTTKNQIDLLQLLRNFMQHYKDLPVEEDFDLDTSQDLFSFIHECNPKTEDSIDWDKKTDIHELLLRFICNGAFAISKDMNIDHKNNAGFTLLHLAVLKKDIPLTKLLIKHGADVNTQDKKHYTPLLSSIKIKDIELTTLLLVHGANPNLHRPHNAPLMHDAVLKQNIELVELLLKYGADVNIKTKKGDTALDFANKCNQQYIDKDMNKARAKVIQNSIKVNNIVTLLENAEKEQLQESTKPNTVLAESTIDQSLQTLCP